MYNLNKQISHLNYGWDCKNTVSSFFIILGNKVYATTGIIKDKTVKLRKEPNSKTVLDYVYKDDEVVLNYEVSRKGEGSVSRAVKVEDPNMLRFPEVVQKYPYTYMMWFKTDKLNHSSQGTNHKAFGCQFWQQFRLFHHLQQVCHRGQQCQYHKGV